MDFEAGTHMFPLRRKIEVEEKRARLTKVVKNLALNYLVKIKASRNKASFNQIIHDLIQKKKADKIKEKSKK